jgi:hypothetical protein
MQPLLFATPFVIQVFRYGLTVSNNTKKSISEFTVSKGHFFLLSGQSTEFIDLIRDRKWELVPQITGLNKLFLYTECQPLIIRDAVNDL